ncbi:unnamed protein product [Microthlaspi erraticum]|uniref:RRM domain-containing protein n=1 Tax=Microthlaspi erraticum TaxID=1685480 RepID=A0A6D2I873_9BRAS|nr:unnamed protein product [Microthlaspi erraticum]
MDPIGGFHEVEKDGTLTLTYHHPKYCPQPQIEIPIPSAPENHLLFLCPHNRWRKHGHEEYSHSFLLSYSPEYVFSATRTQRNEPEPSVNFKMVHEDHILPLFWCNNKEFDVDGGCTICCGSKFGTDYYFCDYSSEIYHKECVESPLQIKHPYHHQHSLQLYFHPSPARNHECVCCGREVKYLVYTCSICEIFMHPVCAMKCNFVAHNDCMYFPRIIKISRHNHRIFYTSSLRLRERSCGVCRKSIDNEYGAYTCHKCDGYDVHPKCALRKDVCDGLELEGVPEDDDITKDLGPFDIISEGVIQYFLHDHHLRLEVSTTLYDENKFCQACVLPIFESSFYSCMECNFILHRTCANAPRRIQNPLHRHPLTLKAISGYDEGAFECDTCNRVSGGFVYQCSIRDCNFDLDVRCASISEPFDYEGHEHPLFLSLDPEEKIVCEVCKSERQDKLNCISCDYVVCIKCATLPFKARVFMAESSKVIHVRNVGHEISENDLLQLFQPFGVITKLVMLRAKNQALLQMQDVSSAVSALQFFTNVQPTIRGRNVYIQFSSHQELTTIEQNIHGREDEPNRILLVTIHHMLYPITVDVLHQVFSPYGFVEKLVTFQKSAGFQALIQYQIQQCAASARTALQGRNIYDGCCQLDIQFSNLDELQVNYNNDRSRDYTNPNLPSEQKGRSSHPGYGDVGVPYPQMANTAAIAAAFGGGLPPGITGTNERVTVLASNLNADSIDEDKLFNLFSLYGNIVRIKLLRNKPDHALIQMGDGFQAELAVHFLKGAMLFGKRLEVNFSKHPNITPGTDSHDYVNSNLNRFNRNAAKNYRYCCSPTKMIHLSTLPQDVTEEEVVSHVQEHGAIVNTKVFEMNGKKQALVQFENEEEAAEALVCKHATSLGGSIIRISFSQLQAI